MQSETVESDGEGKAFAAATVDEQMEVTRSRGEVASMGAETRKLYERRPERSIGRPSGMLEPQGTCGTEGWRRKSDTRQAASGGLKSAESV